MALGYSLTAAPSSGQHSLEGERFAEKGEAMTDARVLGEWLDRVRRGSLSRRDFARGLLAFGLTPPLISELLRSRGIVHAEPRPATFIPSRRGGGGDLKLLWWQAPTILNPHLAIGVKDGDGSRLFYEPLVSFDPEGNLVPVLAAEVPTVQNGMVARDGLAVTRRRSREIGSTRSEPHGRDVDRRPRLRLGRRTKPRDR